MVDETVDLADVGIVLDPDDDVAVAIRELPAGPRVRIPSARGTDGVEVHRTVPRGHKLAVRDVPADALVHKYGQPIGRAVGDLAAGDWVHVHNLAMSFPGQATTAGEPRPVAPASSAPRTFLGYRRSDGSVGTRNYLGVLTSVNCAASTARLIADQFRTRTWPGTRTSTGSSP